MLCSFICLIIIIIIITFVVVNNNNITPTTPTTTNNNNSRLHQQQQQINNMHNSTKSLMFIYMRFWIACRMSSMKKVKINPINMYFFHQLKPLCSLDATAVNFPTSSLHVHFSFREQCLAAFHKEYG